MGLKVIMLGDIVGKPGRLAVEQQLPEIRRKYTPDLVIVNAENIAGGSGITPQLYQKLIDAGIDGITLGDHVYKQKEIVQTLASATNITRPANLPATATGRVSMTLKADPMLPSLCVITLLGRIYMTNGPLGDDPFATIDRMLRQIPADTAVLVEMHCETTSEKAAMGHYLDGRVAAVVGTHTHIPTADAKILPGGTAFITDLGMSGPYDSVIGRRKERVLQQMTTGMPAVYEVADGDPRVCGVFIEINSQRKATRIERVEFAAETDKPPFS